MPAMPAMPAMPVVAASTAAVGAAEFSEAAFGDAAMNEPTLEPQFQEAYVEGGPAVDPFADTDRDWSKSEVIEVREPSNTSWFDDLDSVTAELPPPEKR